MQRSADKCLLELNVYDMAGATVAGNICAVSFIGIDVHGKAEIWAYTNDYIAKDGLASFGIDCNANNILILDAKLFGIFGSHMDVTLCNDKAFGELNASFWTNYLDGSGACDVSGLTNKALCAKGNAVGLGNLNLVCLANRSEDGNALDLAVAVLNGNLFLAEELAGLGKGTIKGQFVTLAEKNFNMFLGEMHMACGYFNDEIHE